MGILVTNKDMVKVTTYYVEKEGGEIELVPEKQPGDETSKYPPEMIKSLTVECQRPNFSSAQTLLNVSLIQSASGDRSIDVFSFRNNLLYTLARNWDMVNAEGKAVECSIGTLSSLRVEIAKDLSSKLEAALGGINNILPLF